MPSLNSAVDYKAKGGDKIKTFLADQKARGEIKMRPVKLELPEAHRPPPKKRSRTTK